MIPDSFETCTGMTLEVLDLTTAVTNYGYDAVTYTLTIYNTGNVTDSYTIAGGVAGQPWTTNWPSAVGPVAGGGSGQFDVTVYISSTASSESGWVTLGAVGASSGPTVAVADRWQRGHRP